MIGWSHDCLEDAASITADIAEGSTFAAVRVDGRNGWPIDVDANGDGSVSCSEVLSAWESDLADEL